MHEVLANRLGGLSLPRKSVVRLTDRPDITLDVYRGRKTTMQQQQQITVACRIVFAKPEDLEAWPNHLIFRFLTTIKSSSYGVVLSPPLIDPPGWETHGAKKVKVSHSLIAVGAVGVRVPLYLGHSWWKAEPIPLLSLPYPSLIRKRYPFSAGLTKRVFQSPHGAAEPWTHAIRRLSAP